VNQKETRDKKSLQDKRYKDDNINVRFQHCRNTNNAKKYTKNKTF